MGGGKRQIGASYEKRNLIRFGSYNIQNGHNSGLESALRGIYQANMNLGFLQKTKVTEFFYTRVLEGYTFISVNT